MEKQQLELLINENSELKKQMELLKKEILILKNNIKINDLIDDDFSSTTTRDLCLEITLEDKDDDGLTFSVCSNHNRVDFENTIEISYDEIYKWLREKNEPLTKENINRCIETLYEDEIDNLM